MLESLALVTKATIEIILAVVIFRLVVERSGLENYKFLTWAIIGSFTFSILIINIFNFFGDREIFDAILAAAASILVIALSYYSHKVLMRKKLYFTTVKKRGLAFVGFSLVIVTLGKAIETLIFISNIFIMNTVINSDLIMKLSGSLLGIIISLLLMFILLRIKNWMSDKVLAMAIYLMAFIIVFRHLITIFQTLFAIGFLPLKPWALAIISPLINTYYPMVFYVILTALFFLWYIVKNTLHQNKPDVVEAQNPAVKRKVLSKFIKERKWVVTLATTLLLVTFILSGNAVMANRKAKIDPPIPLTANNGVITIPLSQLEDYNLHRFSYMTPNNIEVRFVVIRKGESMYGSGLDACEICGKAGYYQRGKEIICKNCDVVINIPTIGFPGGCNPIPIKNKIDGQALVVHTAELEERQDMFSE